MTKKPDTAILGKTVTVTIDRPWGSPHPTYAFIYPCNYGYVEGKLAEDGEYQDAYVLGPEEPMNSFTGEVIAIIWRHDDSENKWVVAQSGTILSAEEIGHAVYFCEQWFDSEVLLPEKE